MGMQRSQLFFATAVHAPFQTTLYIKTTTSNAVFGSIIKINLSLFFKGNNHKLQIFYNS